MLRLMLNDELWSKLRKIMLQHRIYNKPNLRMIVEAMLYRMRVGCPWRDLPADFGCWNAIYQQFNRWSSKNKLMQIFKALSQEPDLEWAFIDGSIVKAHQHNGTLYAGSTSDLIKRVWEHKNNMLPGFTARACPHSVTRAKSWDNLAQITV